MESRLLNYAPETIDARQARSVRLMLQVAWICGALPLTAGLLILTLFASFEWPFLVMAGLYLLPAGTIIVLLGLAMALACLISQRTLARKSRQPLKKTALVLLFALLLSNFPAAFFCAYAGIWLISQPRLTVEVVNNTGQRVDDCIVESDLEHFHVGPLAPSAESRSTLKLRRAGKVKVHLVQAGQSKDLEPELTPQVLSSGGQVLVDIKPGFAPDMMNISRD